MLRAGEGIAARRDAADIPDDRAGRIDSPTGPVELWAQRVPGEDGERVWKISNRTLAQVPSLYQQYGYGKLGDMLSRWLPEYQFLGLYLWQWAVLSVVLVAAYLVAWVITLPAKLAEQKNPALGRV